MTSCAIGIFVKTPGLSPVKSKLAEEVGKPQAERFHQLSCAALESVVQKLLTLSGIPEITPYWVVAEKEGMNYPAWKNFEKIMQGEGEPGERYSRVYNQLRHTHSAVLFLGADSPQVKVEVLFDAAKTLTQSDRFVLGPTEDGGFYMFGGSKPIESKIWKKVPFNDWQTLEILQKELSAIDSTKSFPVYFDVDSKDDLIRLGKILASRQDLTTEQKALLTWVQSLKV